MSCLIPHGKVRLTLVLRLLLFSLLSCHSSRTLPQPKKKKRKRVRKLQPPLPHRATRKCYRHISIFRLSDRQYHSCKSSPSLHYSPVIFYLCQVHKRHPKPKKGSTHTAFRQGSTFFSVAANIVRITCNISQVHYKVNHGRNLLKNTKNHHQK